MGILYCPQGARNLSEKIIPWGQLPPTLRMQYLPQDKSLDLLGVDLIDWKIDFLSCGKTVSQMTGKGLTLDHHSEGFIPTVFP